MVVFFVFEVLILYRGYLDVEKYVSGNIYFYF